MRTQRDYYEILGLPRTASPQEIKKRFRELARKYHPDVHQDKALAQRAFVQIMEAYRTLSDPAARSRYDGSTGGSQVPPRAARQPHVPPRPKGGEGRRLLSDAQYAFVKGRFGEAASLCRQALKINPNLSRAHAVLGDIYRIQGRTEQAISEYGYAVQLDPGDRESAWKMERLVRDEANAIRRESGAPPIRIASAQLLVGNAIGWGIAFLLVLLIRVFPGDPIRGLGDYIPALSQWSGNLVFFLVAAGVLVGLLLSLNGALGHPDEELMFQPIPLAARRARSLPIGIAVVLLSVVLFYGAAAFYLLVAAFQERVSRSVLRLCAAVIAIAVFAAAMYVPARGQVLLYGGNVVFPAMVAGWYVGEFIKPGI